MADTRPYSNVDPLLPGTAAPAPEVRATVPPSPPSLAGVQLGHFRVDKLIAQGGMGAVYRGFDLSLSRPVAIKVIRPDLAQDDRYLGTFLREAQAQANVVHSHVLQAYYVGKAQGTWFLAMQIVDGGSLEDQMQKGKQLSWKDAARHMTAVVAGMAEAARLGIVHRDIKPANILLDHYGDAHVADFGLATSTGLLPVRLGDQPTDDRSRRPGSTQPGVAMGTVEYMPPEQLAGLPLDERADIYAIGVSFYQLLAGELPYPVRDIASARTAMEGPPALPLHKRRPEVPRRFADLIDQCMSRLIDDRPASLNALLEQLRDVGPRPEVTPSPLVRAMSLGLDLIPAYAIFPLTFHQVPLLASAAVALWLAWGLATLSATPGQWMMRLWLRSDQGGDVPFTRAALRSLLQLGWLVPGSLFVSLAYAGSALATPVGAAAALWALVVMLGSLFALGPTRQTLHDRLTRTRVLVATR